MPTYKVTLLKNDTLADGTMAFYFERPKDFQFKAGQYLDLTLVNPPETDAEGNSRSFSIASAPSETSHIMIATRMRDTALKRVLKGMPKGAEVQIDGPMGSFTLHNDASKPAVFLMGGIGITPARSILIQAAHDKLPHKLFLFYSNRRPEDAAFLSELMALEKQNPNYRCIATMTEMAKSKKPWSGATGFIDANMLTQYISHLIPARPAGGSPIYYISGPPAMVAAMRHVLEGMRVNDDNIKTEEFSGY